MKTHKTVLILILAWACGGVRADVLELKNGEVLNGKYLGGTAATVRFETSAGTQAVETSRIIALTFTAPAGATAQTNLTPTANPPATVGATAATNAVTLPAGTTLLVRMVDTVSSKDSPGTKFTTRLEYDVAAGGAVAVKGGTTIYGQVQSSTQARRAVGKSTLDLRLAQIVVGGQPVPITTSGFQEAGPESIRKAARGAAAGGAIGAIAGGEAGKGAAIGATASLLRKGETVTVPPNTLLEFTLTQPVTVPRAP